MGDAVVVEFRSPGQRTHHVACSALVMQGRSEYFAALLDEKYSEWKGGSSSSSSSSSSSGSSSSSNNLIQHVEDTEAAVLALHLMGAAIRSPAAPDAAAASTHCIVNAIVQSDCYLCPSAVDAGIIALFDTELDPTCCASVDALIANAALWWHRKSPHHKFHLAFVRALYVGFTGASPSYYDQERFDAMPPDMCLRVVSNIDFGARFNVDVTNSVVVAIRGADIAQIRLLDSLARALDRSVAHDDAVVERALIERLGELLGDFSTVLRENVSDPYGCRHGRLYKVIHFLSPVAQRLLLMSSGIRVESENCVLAVLGLMCETFAKNHYFTFVDFDTVSPGVLLEYIEHTAVRIACRNRLDAPVRATAASAAAAAARRTIVPVPTTGARMTLKIACTIDDDDDDVRAYVFGTLFTVKAKILRSGGPISVGLIVNSRSTLRSTLYYDRNRIDADPPSSEVARVPCSLRVTARMRDDNVDDIVSNVDVRIGATTSMIALYKDYQLVDEIHIDVLSVDGVATIGLL